jgi:hypothetical protein
MMIRGLHGLFYSSDADGTRAFMRDKLKLPHSDIGGGWLIFDFPEGDVGVHPVDYGRDPGAHDVSFYCDDIQGTVRDLESRGVVFKQPPQDHGYGWVTYFEMPGGVTVQLYEPTYTKRASKLDGKKARPAKPAAKKPAPAKKPVKKSAKPAKKPAKPAKRR